VALRLSMPAPLRVLRDALGLGSHAFICAGNNVGGDNRQLSTTYIGSLLRDVRVSAGFGLVCRNAALASSQTSSFSCVRFAG
jgi:hypothetical protein